MSKRVSIEAVFDELGWGEGINHGFKSGEVFENEKTDKYWQLDLLLETPREIEGSTITGVSIWNSETVPLTMSYNCLKCEGGVEREILIDDVSAITHLLKVDLGVMIGL